MLAICRRTALALSAAAVLLAAASRPATAAELAKKWEVGAGVGRSVYDNDSTLGDDQETILRGGYHFGPRHGAEISLLFQSTESDVKDSGVSFDVTRWAINYVFDFQSKKPDAKLAPMVLFGAGRMSWDTGDESAGSTLIQSGGGVRIMFRPWLALRAEGRLFHYHGDRDLIPRDGFFGFDADVGVSFFFGG
jgi:hypothetical protein